jgi:hypothetical protein
MQIAQQLKIILFRTVPFFAGVHIKQYAFDLFVTVTDHITLKVRLKWIKQKWIYSKYAIDIEYVPFCCVDG